MRSLNIYSSMTTVKTVNLLVKRRLKAPEQANESTLSGDDFDNYKRLLKITGQQMNRATPALWNKFIYIYLKHI